MAAVSPVKPISYIWSSIIGNLSHIWLFAIISASILIPDIDNGVLILTYAGFCAVLLAVFFLTVYRKPGNHGKDNEVTM
jgi:uncharacterized membrane protein YdjX (TVP38/TMEM64 family)